MNYERRAYNIILLLSFLCFSLLHECVSSDLGKGKPGAQLLPSSSLQTIPTYSIAKEKNGAVWKYFDVIERERKGISR